MAPPDTLFPQTMCQCRRKNCGQLDLFPPRDAYHPMSEYPTYHTHGRYIPPGSTRRSPYEEVRVGLAVLCSGRAGAREGCLQSPENLEGKGGAEDAAQGLASMGSEVRGGLGRGPWEEGDLQGEGPHSRRLQLAFPALPNERGSQT